MFPSSVWSVLFYMLATCYYVAGQRESGYTTANECRHTSISSRPNLRSVDSAQCFIPAQTRNIKEFSLRDTVHPEWRWVLEHHGAVSGQVITSGIDFVYMLSQKVCIDRGKAIGRPMTRYYRIYRDQFRSIGFVGDFETSKTTGDAYFDCVFNPKQWWQYLELNTSNCSTKCTTNALPRGLKQYLRIHDGGFKGLGSYLMPFNFTYDSIALETSFRKGLKVALNCRKREQPLQIEASTGHPVLAYEYPHATGTSLLSPSLGLEGFPHKHTSNCLSSLGWNHALKALGSLGNRPDPPQSFSQQIKLADFVGITLLTCMSVFSFRKALDAAGSARRRNVQDCRELLTSCWARVKTRQEHCGISKKFEDCLNDVAGVSASLGVAVITIVVAILEFYESDYRYQVLATVNQGGVITNGITHPPLSVDPENFAAGTEFIVSHWYVVQIKRIGRKYVFQAVVAAYLLLLLLTIQQVYRFSLKREHKLDHWLIQMALRPVSFSMHLAQSVLGLLLSALFNVRPIISCENAFLDLCARISDAYSAQPIQFEERPIWKMFRELKLDYRPEPNPVSLEPNFGEEMATWLDNESEGTRNESIPPLLGNGNVQNSLRRDSMDICNYVTVDEVEKAAAILAEDAFGRLSYPKTLTLMMSETLQRAADAYIEQNRLPSRDDIKKLAIVYYITEVIVPTNEGCGMHHREVRIVDVAHDWQYAWTRRPEYAVSDDRVLAPILALLSDNSAGVIDLKYGIMNSRAN